ncbi:hypothetical protein [Salipiger abyssi]|uniref:hypothetical protein n=1 Tax=Salipiger abyssi TaxID=1250539 RepID=UPI001A8F4621|nr:hypothetical protein [Salipiger abyssi]MBN9886586.1 hypothetical protein [Salipiger abyssi]
MNRPITERVTAFPVTGFPTSAPQPDAAAAPRARLFSLMRQQDSQTRSAGFVEERVISPYFARAFQERAVASFRHPPALRQD